MKTTLNIDDELYRALKVEAARDGTPVQAILDTVLRRWLDERDAGAGSRPRVSELSAGYRTSRDAPPPARSRQSTPRRDRLSREQLLARWRNLPSYDPMDLRRDIDRTFDTSL